MEKNLLDILTPLNDYLNVKSAAIMRAVSKITKEYIVVKNYNKIFYFFKLWKENAKQISYERQLMKDYDDWCQMKEEENYQGEFIYYNL